MRLTKMSFDTPDLRLVDGDDGDGGEPMSAPPDPVVGERSHADLVSEVIGEAGLLPADKLDQVRRQAVDTSFSQALVDEGLASSLGVARTLAEQYHLPLVDLAVAGVDAAAAKTIALPVLERVCAIPFASEGATLKVAITDPQNVQGLDELRLATQRPIEFFVAAKSDVLTELRRLSRASEALNATFEEAAAEVEGEEDDLEADDGISDAPLVRLVNSIIFQAAEEGASDIHVEPQEDELVVRYRIDGVLHVAQRIPKKLTPGVTTRLKVLAKLDIAERRKPQDGRITLTAAAAGRMLDIRVATLPTVEGETVTMRLLDKSREVPTLQSLGLSERMREQLSAIVAKPTGAAARDRPDGLGQVDHPVCGAGGDQPPGDQRDHGRGPGRVPARRDQAGADQPARRAHVRDRSPLDPPFRPRRGHGRRGPRRRDGAHLDRGCAHRPPRALDAAHERRAVRADAAERDGRRALHHRRRRLGRAGAAARAQALWALLRRVPAGARGAALAARRRGDARFDRRLDLPSPRRLRALRQYRATRAGSASSSCSR